MEINRSKKLSSLDPSEVKEQVLENRCSTFSLPKSIEKMVVRNQAERQQWVHIFHEAKISTGLGTQQGCGLDVSGWRSHKAIMCELDINRRRYDDDIPMCVIALTPCKLWRAFGGYNFLRRCSRSIYWSTSAVRLVSTLGWGQKCRATLGIQSAAHDKRILEVK